ncbi:MAG: M23 family metallopeptidase [Oscillospiraceae bacterium]|nr:M23 family metallopeptidase [Oscillospiraceae bacterium]
MNKEEKSKSFRDFVKDKGYYIVLLLCAAVVGVSGYLLLSNGNSKTQDVSLAATQPPSTAAPSEPARNSTQDVIATQGEKPTQATEPAVKEMQVIAPVDGEPINAYAADYLAYNVTTRDWRTHEGIDFSAAVGDEVVSAAAGTVYTIYEDDYLGTTVVIRHENGYTTHYSNLAQALSVEVGDSVDAGTKIGTVGQTAVVETAAEPHLHFAVYVDNVPVDPSSFLKLS